MILLGEKKAFLNLKSELYGNVIQDNPFFKTITLKILESSCHSSAQSPLLS
jgi:hypothetical protein